MSPPIAVVGAGIVGLCTALSLQRDGQDVVLIDRDEPGRGTSFGNAGIICSRDSSVPMPSYALLREVPSMLLDRDASLVLRWRHLPRMVPWIAAFLRACDPERRKTNAGAMAALLGGTLKAYDDLVRGTPADTLIVRRGFLTVHETAANGHSMRDHELLLQLGCRVDRLDGDETRQLEPSLPHTVVRADYFPDAYSVTNPYGLSRALTELYTSRGGTLQRCEVTGVTMRDRQPRSLATKAGEIAVDGLVVAAGAWSHRIAAMMGMRIPLDTERGYHVHFDGVKTSLSRPVLHGEHHFGITQFTDGLRMAGTVEFAGVDTPPNYDRAGTIRRRGIAFLGETIAAGGKPPTLWMGRRPTLPDFLPAIGPVPGYERIWLAFGHQHLGLSLAARTGAIVADLAAGRDPGLDLTAFRGDRF
ncbi:MAG: FAD-dependent oxidoreductase [Alphaproteobacteria bacterium]|nr:FAD-dependent oxidoreductase [Alphaproteobacteria bacterium]